MDERRFSGTQKPGLLRLVVRHPLANLTLFARLSEGGDAGLCSVAWGIVPGINGERPEGDTHYRLAGWGRRLAGFLDGRRDPLDFPITLDKCTDFQRRVLLAARGIPWGTVVSYKRLAAISGFPGAVRAVASVMRRNPLPLVIPCHRVVCTSGKLGGFRGMTSGRALSLKSRLLANEGVDVRTTKSGGIDAVGTGRFFVSFPKNHSQFIDKDRISHGIEQNVP